MGSPKRVRFAAFDSFEAECVKTICDRAIVAFSGRRMRMDIEMDLAAVHKRYPLDLARMAKADDANLMHDIAGIARYLDRDTGELRDCFVPRFRLRAHPSARQGGQPKDSQ